MKYKTLFSLFISFSGLICPKAYAQKKFSADLYFPDGLTQNKIKVDYDNGKYLHRNEYVINNNSIHISGEYYSKFTMVFIYFDSNKFNLNTDYGYYINDTSAIIDFSHFSSFKNVQPVTRHAYNVEFMGDREYKAFTQANIQEINSFHSIPRNETDTNWFYTNMILINKLADRNLEFIRNNPDLYFSFRLFRTELAPNFFLNPDSLLSFFSTVFPKDLRQTVEGSEIQTILKGRKIALSENLFAPEFKTVDINGDTFQFNGHPGKFILLNFWATWCGPCMEELPAIKKLSDRYPKDKLEIISVSFDRDSTAFIKGVRDLDMNWINIYRDFELATKFGGAVALPMLFLIDTSGKVVYNRQAGNETDLINLTHLDQLLKDQLQ